jgi:hypothetical protein
MRHPFTAQPHRVRSAIVASGARKRRCRRACLSRQPLPFARKSKLPRRRNPRRRRDSNSPAYLPASYLDCRGSRQPACRGCLPNGASRPPAAAVPLYHERHFDRSRAPAPFGTLVDITSPEPAREGRFERFAGETVNGGSGVGNLGGRCRHCLRSGQSCEIVRDVPPLFHARCNPKAAIASQARNSGVKCFRPFQRGKARGVWALESVLKRRSTALGLPVSRLPTAVGISVGVIAGSPAAGVPAPIAAIEPAAIEAAAMKPATVKPATVKPAPMEPTAMATPAMATPAMRR